MSLGIQKKIKDKDIIGLRYVFLDSLDVDPTFEKYKEDYDNCKHISEFFQEYRESTPFKTNESEWDNEYFEQLKMDQTGNFSEKRFEHMREVARIVYADKVKRLTKERKIAENRKQQEEIYAKQLEEEAKKKIESEINDSDAASAREKEAEREIAELKKQQEEIYAKQKQLEEEAKKRIESKRNNLEDQRYKEEEYISKKVIGIGVAAAIIAGVLIIKAVL